MSNINRKTAWCNGKITELTWTQVTILALPLTSRGTLVVHLCNTPHLLMRILIIFTA